MPEREYIEGAGPACDLKSPSLLAETFVSQGAASVDDPQETCTPEEFFHWARQHVKTIRDAKRLMAWTPRGLVMRMTDGGAVVALKRQGEDGDIWLIAAAKVDANGVAWAPIDADDPDWAIIGGQPGAPKWHNLLTELEREKADAATPA